MSFTILEARRLTSRGHQGCFLQSLFPISPQPNLFPGFQTCISPAYCAWPPKYSPIQNPQLHWPASGGHLPTSPAASLCLPMLLPLPQGSAWCLRVTVHSFLYPPLHRVTSPTFIRDISHNSFLYLNLFLHSTLGFFISHLHSPPTWSFIFYFCSLQSMLHPITILTFLKFGFQCVAYLFNNLQQLHITYQTEFWCFKAQFNMTCQIASPILSFTSSHTHLGGGIV